MEKKESKEEIMKYFEEQYKKCEVSVVPGHWPNFKSKKEVDEWINSLEQVKLLIAHEKRKN